MLRGFVARLALLFVLACNEAPVPRSLHELERMAFVPAGRGVLAGFGGPLATYAAQEPLLVDLFEVTRGDWLHYAPEPGIGRPFVLADSPWRPETASWPAYMTLEEAQDFARRRGMRLLTAPEWLFVAIGGRANRYPWGDAYQQAVANTLELAPHQPLPVGTFEQGRSPFGCYDMLGNVWEWVEEIGLEYGDSPAADSDGRATALGGSYRYRARPLYGPSQLGESSWPVFLALGLDEDHLSNDVGVRCCVEAGSYLRDHAEEWSRHAERLLAIGARFGAPAVPLLEALEGESRAPALRALLDGARGALASSGR